MYSKTGQHTESWDTPTSPGYCHRVCLPLGMPGTQQTHPLIGDMRPEVVLRMRELFPGIRIPGACADTQLRARQNIGVASPGDAQV